VASGRHEGQEPKGWPDFGCDRAADSAICLPKESALEKSEVRSVQRPMDDFDANEARIAIVIAVLESLPAVASSLDQTDSGCKTGHSCAVRYGPP
jgi:hypothetical protein